MRSSPIDRSGASVTVAASHVGLKTARGRDGSDREGRATEDGPIDEVDAYGGAESRTESSAVPKAAPAVESRSGVLDAIAYERGGNQRFGRHREVTVLQERVGELGSNATVMGETVAQTHPCLAFGGLKEDVPLLISTAQTDPDVEMRELLSSMSRDAKSEIEEDEKDILALVRSMGGDQRRYKRERR